MSRLEANEPNPYHDRFRFIKWLAATTCGVVGAIKVYRDHYCDHRLCVTVVSTTFLAYSASLVFKRQNRGHRACGGAGEAFPDLPENSVASLEAGLSGDGDQSLQHSTAFSYLEFDVQETKDGELVLDLNPNRHCTVPCK